MRNFLMSLVVVFGSVPVFGSEESVEIDNKTEFDEEKYIRAIASELGIHTHARIHISETSEPLRKLNKSIELLGLAQMVADDVYVIYVDPDLSKKMVRVILAHELVHVKQFQDRELIHLPQGVEYKGQIYYKDDNYFTRPYEMEAMGKQYKLYRKFKHIE